MNECALVLLNQAKFFDGRTVHALSASRFTTPLSSSGACSLTSQRLETRQHSPRPPQPAMAEALRFR